MWYLVVGIALLIASTYSTILFLSIAEKDYQNKKKSLDNSSSVNEVSASKANIKLARSNFNYVIDFSKKGIVALFSLLISAIKKVINYIKTIIIPWLTPIKEYDEGLENNEEQNNERKTNTLKNTYLEDSNNKNINSTNKFKSIDNVNSASHNIINEQTVETVTLQDKLNLNNAKQLNLNNSHEEVINIPKNFTENENIEDQQVIEINNRQKTKQNQLYSKNNINILSNDKLEAQENKLIQELTNNRSLSIRLKTAMSLANLYEQMNKPKEQKAMYLWIMNKADEEQGDIKHLAALRLMEVK
jgi:hypothetical protein